MNYARDRFWSKNKITTEIPDLLDKIEKTKNKLNNESFLKNAPIKIIEIENQKLIDFNNRLSSEINKILKELDLTSEFAEYYIQIIREAEYLNNKHLGIGMSLFTKPIYGKINWDDYNKNIYSEINPIDYDRLYFEIKTYNLWNYIQIVRVFWESYKDDTDKIHQEPMESNKLQQYDTVIITYRKPFLNGDKLEYNTVKVKFDCINNPEICAFGNDRFKDVSDIIKYSGYRPFNNLSLAENNSKDRIFANSIESYYFGSNKLPSLCNFAENIVNISVLRCGHEVIRPKFNTGDIVTFMDMNTKKLHKYAMVDYDKKDKVNTNKNVLPMYTNYTATGNCNQYSIYCNLKMFQTSTNPVFSKFKLIRIERKKELPMKQKDLLFFRNFSESELKDTYDHILERCKVYIVKRQYKFLHQYLYDLLPLKRGNNNPFDHDYIDRVSTELKQYHAYHNKTN